jgi:1,4-alpha-glucan branching enzyme
MKRVKTNQNIKRRKVTFSLEASDAKEVVLIGDFNNWNPKKHPMQKDENGIWNKAVIIPPGNYEYKFLVDGEWKEDPQNDKKCANCFGTHNSIFNLTIP